jgi:hypothetical protein
MEGWAVAGSFLRQSLHSCVPERKDFSPPNRTILEDARFLAGGRAAPPIHAQQHGAQRPNGPSGPSGQQVCHAWQAAGFCSFDQNGGKCKHRHVCVHCGSAGHHGGGCTSAGRGVPSSGGARRGAFGSQRGGSGWRSGGGSSVATTPAAAAPPSRA